MRCSEKEAWWHHQRICSARDAFTTLPEFRARLYKLQADVNALLTTLEQLEDKGFQVEEAAQNAAVPFLRSIVAADPVPEFARAVVHALLFRALWPVKEALPPDDDLALSSRLGISPGAYAAIALEMGMEDLAADCLAACPAPAAALGGLSGASPALAGAMLPRLLLLLGLGGGGPSLPPPPPDSVLPAVLAAARRSPPLGAPGCIPALADFCSAGLEAAACPGLHDGLALLQELVLAEFPLGLEGCGGGLRAALSRLLARLGDAVDRDVHSASASGGPPAVGEGFSLRCHLRTRLLLLLGGGAGPPVAEEAAPVAGGDGALPPPLLAAPTEGLWERVVGEGAAEGPGGMMVGEGEAGEAARAIAAVAPGVLPGVGAPPPGLEAAWRECPPGSASRGALLLAWLVERAAAGGAHGGRLLRPCSLLMDVLGSVAAGREQRAVLGALLLGRGFGRLRRLCREGGAAGGDMAALRRRSGRQLIALSNRMTGGGAGGRTEEAAAAVLPHAALFPEAVLRRLTADALAHRGQAAPVAALLRRLRPLSEAAAEAPGDGAGGGERLLAAALRGAVLSAAHEAGSGGAERLAASAWGLLRRLAEAGALPAPEVLHAVAVPLLEVADSSGTRHEDRSAVLPAALAAALAACGAPWLGHEEGADAGVGVDSVGALFERLQPWRLLGLLLDLADPLRPEEPCASAAWEQRLAASRLLRLVAVPAIAAADGADRLRSLCREAPWRVRLLVAGPLLGAAEGALCQGGELSEAALRAAGLWPPSLASGGAPQGNPSAAVAADLVALALASDAGAHAVAGGSAGTVGPEAPLAAALRAALSAAPPAAARRGFLAAVCEALPLSSPPEACRLAVVALPGILSQPPFAGAGARLPGPTPAALSMDLCARAAVALLRAAKEQGRRFLLDGDRAVERYCAAAKHAVELAGAGDRAPLAVRLFRDAVGVAHCAADAGAAVGPPQALLLQLVDAIAAAGEPRPWDWDCLRACAEEAPPPVSAVLAFSLRKLGAAA